MFLPTKNEYKFKYLKTGITGKGIPCVYLPEQPSDSQILFKKEQKFVRQIPSPQLQEWMDECAQELSLDPKYIHPHQASINKWIDAEWKKYEEGIWFWNDGVPTFLTGRYYKYLSIWNLYFGFPDYRETDKECFYWIAYWEEDPNAYGGAYNTCRREGKSTKMGFWITDRTITNFDHFSGMQGEDNNKIQDFYNTMIVDPFRKIPFWVQPLYDTTSLQKKGILFKEPPRRNKKKIITKKDAPVLNSRIDYRTSEENKYDQAVLHSYAGEEFGKCHPAGTMVRMFDGSLKDVINVREGDLLMGDDSTSRTVKKLGSGFGKIFKIIPNSKAEPWYVNEYHILSCKSSSRHHTGYKKGTTINLSVQEYFALSKAQRKNLMCYRIGVDYNTRGHTIDPYLFGVWLGDGSSGSGEITNEDAEVIDFIKDNWDGKVYQKRVINRTQTYTLHGLYRKLRLLNLLNNKHIPNEYMIDSRENRLKLLAGLIDTDGYRNQRVNKRHYEIIQKRKDLSYQIQELCLSLGFSCTLNPKRATMKRKDGTVFVGIVYRMSIFGYNLYDIPCKITRKKMPVDITTYNSKDPCVYGFTIKYDREDWYYGFNISGNRLYVLKDYTVTHNTLTANVDKRWGFVKPCLKRGIYIRGKAFIGTTSEYMDVSNKGGQAYMKLCMESDFDVRNKIGQTKSGLYAALMPADCVLEGFIDEHGRPMRKQAMQWILDERESVRDNPKDYATLVRKYPTDWSEVFYVSAESCEFNIVILQDRKRDLQINPVPIRKFNLNWENNLRPSEASKINALPKVIMTDNPDTGWFKTTWLPNTPEEQKWMNNVERYVVNGKTMYRPLNNNIFGSGVDPIDHGVVVDSVMGTDGFVSSRRSRPVLFIKRKYDSTIDGQLNQEILEQRAREKYPYKTGKYFAMMDTRPNDPNVFFERCLMIWWLFGISGQIESSKPGVINWLNDSDCGDFSFNKYVPNPENIKKSDIITQGTPASAMMTQEFTAMLATDVEYFGHTFPFIEQPEDLLQFDPLNTKKFDYSVAMGQTEIACKQRAKTVSLPFLDIGTYFRSFGPNGNLVTR